MTNYCLCGITLSVIFTHYYFNENIKFMNSVIVMYDDIVRV